MIFTANEGGGRSQFGGWFRRGKRDRWRLLAEGPTRELCQVALHAAVRGLPEAPEADPATQWLLHGNAPIVGRPAGSRPRAMPPGDLLICARHIDPNDPATERPPQPQPPARHS